MQIIFIALDFMFRQLHCTYSNLSVFYSSQHSLIFVIDTRLCLLRAITPNLFIKHVHREHATRVTAFDELPKNR